MCIRIKTLRGHGDVHTFDKVMLLLLMRRDLQHLIVDGVQRKICIIRSYHQSAEEYQLSNERQN